MRRQLQSNESFPFLVDTPPPPRPPPSKWWQLPGHPSGNLFPSLRRQRRAGGQQLNAVRGGGSAPLRRGLPPRWLQRCHRSGSPRSLGCPSPKPNQTPGQRGAGSLRAGEATATTEGASESPAQRLPRSAGARRGKSRLLEGEAFPRPARGTPGAAGAARPTWVSVSRGPASASAPSAPARAGPPSAAGASPPASARARARRARQPRRCHGGGEHRPWARGRPREPGRGWLCQSHPHRRRQPPSRRP